MYYDLLVKIKNAEGAKKKTLVAPFSNLDFEVAKLLVRTKYLADVQKRTSGKKNFLDIKLLSGGRGLSGLKIISKPRRHIYVDYRSLYSVKQGYGMGVLSTSKGVMSDKEAKKNKIGGEYLFQLW